MSRSTHFLLSLTLLFLSSYVIAQDVHFSQFYLSPLTTNPSFTGKTPGDWRFTANHRNQWNMVGKPYNTTSLGFEHNFYLYNEKFSAGLLYLHDESGIVGLRYDKIMLSGAYHKKYDIHQFHIGFQPGIVIKAVDLSNASLPDQYDRTTGGFNSSLPNSDQAINQNINYFDFNMGIGYSLDLNKVRLETGFSMFHVNQPNESFFNETNELPIRNTFTAGAEISLTEKLNLIPNIMYMNHAKAAELLTGCNLEYLLKENRAKATGLYAGVILRNGFNRNTDAVIAVVGAKFSRLEIGVNYDINVSDLRYATNSRGALEFSVVYTGATSVLSKTAVPCDRF